MDYGLENLKKHNNKVDYIITHQPPESIMLRTSVSKLDFNEFTTYLEKINYTINFKKWYSGHIHLDYEFDNRHTSMYENWERII